MELLRRVRGNFLLRAGHGDKQSRSEWLLGEQTSRNRPGKMDGVDVQQEKGDSPKQGSGMVSLQQIKATAWSVSAQELTDPHECCLSKQYHLMQHTCFRTLSLLTTSFPGCLWTCLQKHTQQVVTQTFVFCSFWLKKNIVLINSSSLERVSMAFGDLKR